jgi:hypothetical protein
VLDHLAMREPDHLVAEELELHISLPISLERRPPPVEAVPVGFDHEPMIPPEEVD